MNRYFRSPWSSLLTQAFVLFGLVLTNINVLGFTIPTTSIVIGLSGSENNAGSSRGRHCTFAHVNSEASTRTTGERGSTDAGKWGMRSQSISPEYERMGRALETAAMVERTDTTKRKLVITDADDDDIGGRTNPFYKDTWKGVARMEPYDLAKVAAGDIESAFLVPVDLRVDVYTGGRPRRTSHEFRGL